MTEPTANVLPRPLIDRFPGAAGCTEYIALLRADFPNARFAVEDAIVSVYAVVRAIRYERARV